MTFREDGLPRRRLGGGLSRARRRAARARAGQAGRHPCAPPAVAAGAAGVVRRGAPRPRRDPPPGPHALAAPAVLRLLRSLLRGTRHPRGAARRNPEFGCDSLAHRAGLDRARGDGARLGRPADRHPSRVARPHRGHGVHFDARGADRGAPRDRAQRRRVLRARAFIGREGRAHARDGGSEGARRRGFSHAARRARARRRGGRRRHRRDDFLDLRRSGRRDRGSLRGRRARGCTSTPPTQAPRWSAPSSAGRSRASTAPTPSSSTRTNGCSLRWTAR